MVKYVKTEDGYQEIEELNSNKMDKNNPVGTGSFSMGRKVGSVIGNSSHAEGYNTTASGDYSHAEGGSTTASGNTSHAEGRSTTASGDYSHAEGGSTTASGGHSHAEGRSTTASGENSHAEGFYTTARGAYQHVQGKFNIEDTNNKYSHIVGNGANIYKCSNAHTLDWNGNAWFAGTVKVGGTGQDDIAAKTLATTEDIPTVDSTLTQSGQAADAKAIGDAIRSLSDEIVTTAESKVSEHNSGTDTHSDIRLLIQDLTGRLNALADSDDTTLDQMSEVVEYIKSNKSLIDAITTSKVSVADIVNDLVTNVTDKPLSAAQGVVIKTLIDVLSNDKLDAAELTNAVNTALAQAKASGEFDGADGKTAYQYAQDGGYTGTEAEFAAKLAEDKFANPYALTFTGAVAGSYDGSEPLTVDVPSGGDNGGAWELVADVTMETDVQQIDIALSKSCKRVWVAVTLYGSKQNSGKSDFYIYVGDKDYKNMIGNTNRVNIDFSSASMIWNFQSLYAEVSGGVTHQIRGYQTSKEFINGWETPGNYPSAGLMELFGSAPFDKIETVRLQMWGVYFGAGTRVVVRGT